MITCGVSSIIRFRCRTDRRLSRVFEKVRLASKLSPMLKSALGKVESAFVNMAVGSTDRGQLSAYTFASASEMLELASDNFVYRVMLPAAKINMVDGRATAVGWFWMWSIIEWLSTQFLLLQACSEPRRRASEFTNNCSVLANVNKGTDEGFEVQRHVTWCTQLSNARRAVVHGADGMLKEGTDVV